MALGFGFNKQKVLASAEKAVQQGKLPNAIREYEKIVREEAARIFQNSLEPDSDNTAMQTKLADLYIKLGRKDNARDIFLTAANALYQRGALDAADEALRRVNSIDPNNLDALLLRGKIASDSGDSAAAISYLEKIPDLDSRPEALRSLLNAQLFMGKFAEAEMIAKKMLTVHNDASGLTACAESLLKGGSLEEALQLYDKYSDRLL